MLSAAIFFISFLALRASAGVVDAGAVVTVERVYHTIIDQSPFLVDRTTTIVWTQGPSIVDTETPTATPTASV
ncbi:hypothetical protein Hypma_005137 [Hypsizygus marmoreus]|uniref:Secreted protein n=1 Tax=Hypsizygus marmoreus TaxID=39966 RepID=A0A369K7W1_HYPMA|nr:hypothetical protein Hypma_005137 [Hypsizygus marmoreus]